MRIACPACATAYEVPDRLLAGPPRTLRCSRCGAQFALPVAEPAAPAQADVAMAELPAEPLPPVAEPHPVPVPLALPARVPPGPSRALAGAWIASLAVVVAAVIGFFAFQGKVMEVWPASTRLFAALGLA